ncbi:protein of unknown function [Streptantibioticus cattleyicolor NRRL 8057 = DSM 46488]|nr:protein of unknown function [Streptantibioticus cattleyicolor NRRL 8057 = DSM 46488]
MFGHRDERPHLGQIEIHRTVLATDNHRLSRYPTGCWTTPAPWRLLKTSRGTRVRKGNRDEGVRTRTGRRGRPGGGGGAGAAAR